MIKQKSEALPLNCLQSQSAQMNEFRFFIDRGPIMQSLVVCTTSELEIGAQTFRSLLHAWHPVYEQRGSMTFTDV